MTEAEIERTADDVLSRVFDHSGFESAKAEIRPNHVDEDSIFVTARFRGGGGPYQTRRDRGRSRRFTARFQRKGRRSPSSLNLSISRRSAALCRRPIRGRVMPKKTPGPYVRDLLATADALAEQGGSATFRQACMRRAVSTAYYAVFHALCAACSDELVGWSRTALLPPIYRSLDHGVVSKRLTSKEVARVDSRIERLGLLFASLQEQRHTADYAPPAAIFSSTQTRLLIEGAREAISLIEGLDATARLKLAILLVARHRSA